MYVQYGCGFSSAEGWLNFDSSPTLKAERVPFLGALVKKNSTQFPKNVLPGDIVRGLPVQDASADGVYASHILEHLARCHIETALKNTYRIMRSGGIFRLVVPDLEVRAEKYLSKLGAGDRHANDWFMRSTSLGLEHHPSSLMTKISRFAGGSSHLWMWDFRSIEAVLSSVGFHSIRRCSIGDSNDPMFSRVERADRFNDTENGFTELAVHCVKP
jgi:predicted SAM-dependent methyltransferase